MFLPFCQRALCQCLEVNVAALKLVGGSLIMLASTVAVFVSETLTTKAGSKFTALI